MSCYHSELHAGNHYVHNDHLNTPQVVTNQNQQVVWAADYEPFGKLNLITNTVEIYSRFPGQYFDAETGNYYNYFRDYDPSIGGYLTSDPIGLNGGINTYAYAGGNPLSYFDFFGLAYATMEEAAKAALCKAYPSSYADNAEYGGRIVKTDDGYDFTPAITQGHDSQIDVPFQAYTTETKKHFLGIIPYTVKTYRIADNTVGWYHTHSRPSKSHDHQSYSRPDAKINKQFNIPGWYTDGNGVVRVGDKGGKVGEAIGECTCEALQ